MREAKAYLASQLGFSETGLFVLEKWIIPEIEKIGIIINNPFSECAKNLDLEHLGKIEKLDEERRFWRAFNLKVTPTNNKLMEESDCMLAILDGGHAVDDGVSGEMGYYAGIQRGPIITLRSDFRLGENIATSINPQLSGYIFQSRGVLVDRLQGPNATERWFAEIKKWYDSFRK